MKDQVDEVLESVKEDEREEKKTIMEEMCEIEEMAHKLGNLIDAKTSQEIKSELTKTMETKSQVDEVLEGLPPRSQSELRSMFLSDVRKFEKSPSGRLANRLESVWGMSVDYSEEDYR